MNTITGKTKVWLTNNWDTLDYLHKLVEAGKSDEVVGRMSYTNADMIGIDGWTQVGTADITVHLFDEEVIREGKVDSLKKEIQQVKAKAQREVEILEDRLQQLLALPSPPTDTTATNED